MFLRVKSNGERVLGMHKVSGIRIHIMFNVLVAV